MNDLERNNDGTRSAFGSNSASDSVSGRGIDGVQGDKPSPDEVAMIEEGCQGLFAKLPNEQEPTDA